MLRFEGCERKSREGREIFVDADREDAKVRWSLV